MKRASALALAFSVHGSLGFWALGIVVWAGGMACGPAGSAPSLGTEPFPDAGVAPDAASDAGPPLEPVVDVSVGLEGCVRPPGGVLVDALSSRKRTGRPETRGMSRAARQVTRWPTSATCVADRLQQTLASAAERSGPVGAAIRVAAQWLDERPDARPVDTPSRTLVEAVDRLCALDDAVCPVPSGLAEDLADALTAVLDGARQVIVAHRARGSVRGPSFWWAHGGTGFVPGTEGVGYAPSYADDARYLLDARSDLYEAAARLADAVENVDWVQYRGRRAATWWVDTPFGRIEVRDAADHRETADGRWLLLIDLGGADIYTAEVGTNARPENVVSVLIDVDGADFYGYPGAQVEEEELPADEAGRVTVDRYVDASASMRGGPGGARNGVALAFDLGADDDAYLTLRFGQGYAHQGVGVLFDDGGHDVYRAEALAQGAAQFGIGLVIDRGAGNDLYEAEHVAQGAAYVRGFGALLDDGGDDRYRCGSTGDDPRYPSTQHIAAGASFCQGAGLGARFTGTESSLAGGVGVLVDRRGDDRYAAEVYAQGVGYQDGLGVLSDALGDDRLDAVWYAQGAGVHGGAGVLFEQAGRDQYGAGGGVMHAALGAAHDQGTGVFFDASGDDRYWVPSLGGGAGSCAAVGLFGDEEGQDTYTLETTANLGHALSSLDCPVVGETWGLFAEGRGLDDYGSMRDNDSQWGTAEGSVLSMGVDADLPTGLGVPAR